METGNIVEFIDRQKIVCAVVLEVKDQRLRVLSEHNREFKISVTRLCHRSRERLSVPSGRDRMTEALKERSSRRRALSEEIDIKEIWEVVHTEQEWIDLETMTSFCFSDEAGSDHESAVIRAFFRNRLYFKFNQNQFFPFSEEQVEQFKAKAREEERRRRIIEAGGDWLKNVLEDKNGGGIGTFTPEKAEFVRILRSYYLFEKESPTYELGHEIMAGAGLKDTDILFKFLVRLKIWSPNENVDLHRYEIRTDFSEDVMSSAESPAFPAISSGMGNHRRDLTGLSLMTIDGQSTLDFDDALSLETDGEDYLLGVHISDVSHYVERGSLLDREAVHRASSIYMPDQKIPMLPQRLAEGRCSLKAGEDRPATSTMIRLDGNGKIKDYEIYPSVIRVTDQLTYHDVNAMAEDDANISALYQIAKNFRRQRILDGAVQITLPEINIWIDDTGELIFSKTNRESPGRMLVSEIMIMANWLMARFLGEHDMPAIFRSQPEPRERLYRDEEGTLFQNWMQRKLLSRFVLGVKPEPHSGLGLNAYVTATSPIRKYSDLITQRQLRAALGLETPYSADEVQKTIHALQQPMIQVARLQNRRKRYWLLKYLESRVGQKEDAFILSRRKNSYQALIPEYMIECQVPASGSMQLKPEDVIQVTLQHVNARKDIVSVFMS